jgi:hypothetical protein
MMTIPGFNMRNKIIIAVALLTIIIMPNITSLQASMASIINFQGQLTKSNGSPVTGTLPVTFNIYSCLAGGTALKTLPNVGVSFNANGVFIVQLDLSGLDLNQNLWLGIVAGPDAEMSPRAPILPSAASIFSLNSANAQNSQNSDKLGGTAAVSYFLKSGGTLGGQLNMNNYSVLSSSSIEGINKIVWADGSVSTCAVSIIGGSGSMLSSYLIISTAAATYFKLSGGTLSGQLNMSNYSVFSSSSIEGINKIVWADGSTSTSAVSISGGDMTRAVYDANLNGIVDNAERLGGSLPAVYLSTAVAASTYLTSFDALATYISTSAASGLYLTTTTAGSTYLTLSSAAVTYLNMDGKAASSSNSDLMGGNPPSFYANRADVAASTAAFLTTANVSAAYISSTTAGSTYLTLSSATITYLNIAGKAVSSMNSDELAGNIPSFYANRADVAASTAAFLTTTNALVIYVSTATAASVYLSTITANSTYLTLSSATATYLNSGTVSSAYVTLSSATATYLNSGTASATYLTLSSAAVTYLNIAGNAASSANSDQLGGNLPMYYANRSDVASSTATFLTAANASATYLSISTAGSTYLTLSSAAVTYLNINGKAADSSDSDKLGGNLALYYANRLDIAVSTGTFQSNIDKQFIISPSTGIMAGTLANTVKITTGNISAIGSANDTTFLRGDGSWGNVAGDISYAEMFTNGAAVNTTIGAIETFTKIANDTTAGDLNNFTHTTGRLTYFGLTAKEFRVNVSLNAQNTTAAQTIRFSVAKNGVPLIKSRATVSLTYTTDGYCVSLNCLTSLAAGDYIEVFTANATAATVVTVADLNVVVAAVE